MSNEQKCRAIVAVGPSPLAHGPDDWTEAHASMTQDETVWSRLAFRGIQSGHRGELWELRVCPRCESTINRPVSTRDAMRLLLQLAAIHAQSLDCLTSAIGGQA